MEFKFGLEIPFYTLFKKIQESSSYIYASVKCNNFVCVNMYYVIHMTGGSQQLKFGETYAKSANTGSSGRGHRAPRAHGGAAGAGSLAANSGQDLPMEHRCGEWETPCKEGASGAH
jgi:hypothetical protein